LLQAIGEARDPAAAARAFLKPLRDALDALAPQTAH
jgi:hypothetical protein